MEEIRGKYNTAISFAKVIEDSAREQIRRMCNYPKRNFWDFKQEKARLQLQSRFGVIFGR